MMMGRFGAEIWRILATSVTILMASYSTIHLVSADCSDPGSPLHGGKTVSNGGGRFPVGTVVSFYCNPHYTLSGTPKIKCSVWKNHYYWSGKVPKCNSQGCLMPPPTFAHANITTYPVQNSKGSYVDYSCNDGYLADHHPTRILCDKDPSSHGYKWSGNFTCKKIICGHPPYPSTGHGNYTFYTHGDTFYASYYCYSGYVLLRSRLWLTVSLTRSCDDQSGHWSLRTPTCVKYCSDTDVQLDHGRIKSRKPQYVTYDDAYHYRFAQGVEVTFDCDSRYRLVGSAKLRCLENGQWDVNRPRCVLSKCGSPGGIQHGWIYAQNGTIQTGFPIGTTVTFACEIGYKLHGTPLSRKCLPSGEWTGGHNPTCQKSELTCRPPPRILHGFYSNVQPEYLLNDRVHYHCNTRYYLWGEQTWVCTSVDNIGTWLPGNCLSSAYCAIPPECLLEALFDERCFQKTGNHVKPNNNGLTCPSSPATSTPAVFTRTSNGNDLDKMTIVVATAGSTLGALVVLLTALVCFRRFHRSRRFRHSAFRSQRYSEDDRIAIIAAYTGDVHFILPSYDEAISQVQNSPPPPFEAVVQSAQEGGNQTAPNNNSPNVDEDVNRTGLNSATGAASNQSTSVAREPAANTREVGASTAENQQINIVRNPLAENLHTAGETISADHAMSAVNECGLSLSEESLDTRDFDSSPNNPSEDLPSSSSEDDLTSSQTQPLLGNGRRGVMV